ncbi:MAG: tRNA (adenosine(37)-N6)-threonylcarbamoyltransferase complex ATPase subunit type 1 TsaE [Planctomycetes bacterium]|nr:tRNA (adenosine(37)-N6)-threonylcarbamoyltransferase complex ATPase subunit type 1 TsaE [Planctomycetota bacterium]
MNNKNIEIVTDSAAETIELGERIGTSLKGGEVFALIGNLGTGKTHLIKGISLGLGAHDPDQVSSPTFVLVNEYFGREGLIHIYHIDAYRIDSVGEFEALGFEEYCRPDSVVLVEWADKVLPVLDGVECIQLQLEHVSETQRKIVVQNAPAYLTVS